MKKLFFGIPLLAAALVACPSQPAPTIGATGGTVISSNSVASVTFPADALLVDTPVTITAATGLPAAPANQQFVAGKSFTVAGGMGNFAKPAELKLKLTPAEIASLGLGQPRPQALISQVQVLQLSGSSWVTITYTFDTVTNLLTISIPGYGTWALVVPTPTTPPPAGTLSSIALTCNPTSIAVAATSTCAAVGKDSSGATLATQPALTFASSDTGKATVSSAGVMTGVAAGISNVTASSGGVTSNAVAVTVTAAPTSGSGVTFVSTNPNARGTAISANGQVVLIIGQQASVYDGTTTTALPALPSGYVGVANNIPRTSCIDSNGNVAYMGIKNDRDYSKHAVYYDKTASSVSEIPFADETYVFGCNDAKLVVASDLSTGGKTFEWQAGDASSAQISLISPARSANNAGTVLFQNSILKGTTITPIAAPSGFGSVNAVGLTNAGTVYGDAGSRQLFKWNEGDATVTLLGTPPGQIQDLSLLVLGVNNNGDVLLRATGFASSTDYQYWLYKNGVYTRITVPNYTILEAIGISDGGSILVNIYNSENFGGNYRVALVKP